MSILSLFLVALMLMLGQAATHLHLLCLLPTGRHRWVLQKGHTESHHTSGDAGGGASAAQAVWLQSPASMANPKPSPHEHLPWQVSYALLVWGLLSQPLPALVSHLCACIACRLFLWSSWGTCESEAPQEG